MPLHDCGKGEVLHITVRVSYSVEDEAVEVLEALERLIDAPLKGRTLEGLENPESRQSSSSGLTVDRANEVRRTDGFLNPPRSPDCRGRCWGTKQPRGKGRIANTSDRKPPAPRGGGHAAPTQIRSEANGAAIIKPIGVQSTTEAGEAPAGKREGTAGQRALRKGDSVNEGLYSR